MERPENSEITTNVPNLDPQRFGNTFKHVFRSTNVPNTFLEHLCIPETCLKRSLDEQRLLKVFPARSKNVF
jgi:hypothetical protein